jgi:Rha family phage regulatory protein
MENKLSVFQQGNQLYTDSREVAEMVGKDHKHLLRDIDGYISVLGQSKIGPSDFFVKSTYTSSQNKQLPCYLITKKGCEFVANKLTGEKGIIFTAAYVNAFHYMEDKLSGKAPASNLASVKVKDAEARLNNSRVRKASMYMKIADAKVVPDKYKQVLLSYATKELNGGEAVLPLPPTQKGYSAQEIGDMFGLTANMVGRVANRNGLKKSEYGELREDKSKSSPKEVHTWVYFDSAIPAFEHVLGKKANSGGFSC